MTASISKGNDEIPDFVVAKQAWQKHLLRNDSIV